MTAAGGARRTVALHPLTVTDVATPAKLVEVAARAGYDAIDLFVRFRDGPWPRPVTVESDAEFAALGRSLRDAGIALHTLESFLLTPDIDWGDFTRKLERGAQIGARRVTVFIVDTDEARRIDSFVRAGSIAAACGIALGIESAPISRLRHIAEIAAFIALSGVVNASAVIDLLHVHRNGETPDDLSRIAGRWIGTIQVTDAPLLLPDLPPCAPEPERRMYEAMRQRRYPGEGELPVAAYMRALPTDVPVSIEVPHAAAIRRRVSALARARRALKAWRTIEAEISAR